LKRKSIGIGLIVIGMIMIIYTGFDFVTSKKVVDLGPIKINKEENHPVQWSPIVGVVLLVGGIVVIAIDKKVNI
jgi:drug/metabolite transporter (DMT)-like permease